MPTVSHHGTAIDETYLKVRRRAFACVSQCVSELSKLSDRAENEGHLQELSPELASIKPVTAALWNVHLPVQCIDRHEAFLGLGLVACLLYVWWEP